MNKAIIVIDMQKGFFNSTEKLPTVPRASQIIQNSKKVIEKSRKKKIPIIHVIDLFQKAEKSIETHFKLFGPHAIEGTDEAEIIDELKPQEEDFVIGKNAYDGFFQTRLDKILRELDVDTLIFMGQWTDACVRHTVMGGFFRTYRLIVLEDCTDAPTKKRHKQALNYMEKYYGINILTSDELISQF